jgi:uroporphyrinogen-III decarboxylase
MNPGIFQSSTKPEVQKILETLIKAGKAAEQITYYSKRFTAKLKDAGFPTYGSLTTYALFDISGDYLRSIKEVMLDMVRQPARVIMACEKLLPVLLERSVNRAKISGDNVIFIPLHKGLDGFMPPDQFKKFYWPTLHDLIAALINNGLIPYLFWEEDCTSRLEHIIDIPAAKAIYRFEATDILKASDILRDHVCTRGNIPTSVLIAGTPEDVKSYCKKLIDYAGKDGGFILDSPASVTDAKAENLKAMFDFIKEYGVY